VFKCRKYKQLVLVQYSNKLDHKNHSILVLFIWSKTKQSQGESLPYFPTTRIWTLELDFIIQTESRSSFIEHMKNIKTIIKQKSYEAFTAVMFQVEVFRVVHSVLYVGTRCNIFIHCGFSNWVIFWRKTNKLWLTEKVNIFSYYGFYH
jgi:hypothetical protein